MTAAAIQRCCRLLSQQRGQTHEAEVKRNEAEATCHELDTKAINCGLEVEARPRGLPSLAIKIVIAIVIPITISIAISIANPFLVVITI